MCLSIVPSRLDSPSALANPPESKQTGSHQEQRRGFGDKFGIPDLNFSNADVSADISVGQTKENQVENEPKTTIYVGIRLAVSSSNELCERTTSSRCKHLLRNLLKLVRSSVILS